MLTKRAPFYMISIIHKWYNIMEWLKDYHKNLEIKKRLEKREIEEKLLKDLKKKHILEKEKEIEELKKKLNMLEKDLESIRR